LSSLLCQGKLQQKGLATFVLAGLIWPFQLLQLSLLGHV
jgi:hypothetical protein